MTEAVEWLSKNKEWVFSGIGVLILSLIIAFGRSILHRLWLNMCKLWLHMRQKFLPSSLRTLAFQAPLNSLEQFEPFIKDAQEIFLCGLTLGGLVSSYSSTLEHMVRKKECRLRVVLPQEDIILSCAYKISLNYNPQTRLNEEYQTTLAWLDRLAKHNKENVQIRITETLPTISLLIANPGSPEAKARVSLHVFGGTLNKRPYFEFSRRGHPDWYDFFTQMYYHDLWEKSLPWEMGAKAELKRSQQRLEQIKRD